MMRLQSNFLWGLQCSLAKSEMERAHQREGPGPGPQHCLWQQTAEGKQVDPPEMGNMPGNCWLRLGCEIFQMCLLENNNKTSE
jgi:hypothetical protein